MPALENDENFSCAIDIAHSPPAPKGDLLSMFMSVAKCGGAGLGALAAYVHVTTGSTALLEVAGRLAVCHLFTSFMQAARRPEEAKTMGNFYKHIAKNIARPW